MTLRRPAAAPQWRRGAGVEVLVGVGLLMLTLSLAVAQPTGVLPLGMSAVACAGAVLSAWRLRVGGALALMAVGAMSQLPPSQISVAFHACLVPVFAAAARRRYRLAGVLGAAVLVITTAMTMRQERSLVVVQAYELGWLFLIGLSAGLGWGIGTIQDRGERREREALTQQRQSLALHLHDTVAHDLAVIAMRAQAAELDGVLAPGELHQMAVGAQRAASRLRRLMTLMQDDGPLPALYTDVDLPQALAEGSVRLREAGFTLTVFGDIPPLPKVASCCLAHVVTESLNNVMRHGGREQPCTIMIEAIEDDVALMVTNHIGDTSGSLSRDGLGVEAMRHHCEELGGTLTAGAVGEQWMVTAAVPAGEAPQEEAPALPGR